MKQLPSMISALLFGLSACSVLAQTTFPSKPIRLLVGFEPGGPVDTQARMVAQKISQSGAMQMIVENRPGADAIISTDLVAKSAPDGYTLQMISAGHTMNPNFVKPLPYHPYNDFTPISAVASGPFVLVVHPSLPVKTTQEFIQYVKARPGKLNYGSTGLGSTLMLAMELFKSMAGIQITHIPYKGGAPANSDLLAGRLDAMMNNAVAALQNSRSGKLRALAVTTRERWSAAPELPPVSDALPGFEVDAWYGIIGPKGLPAPVLALLNAEVVKALTQPDIRERFDNFGLQSIPGTPEQLGKLIQDDLKKWAKVVKDTGVSAD